ncbi:MAG TPA: hypothetical protein VH092_13040 [Urbifossiella sp.]|jgi:uncharacterized protein (TIGR02646 family)|nr:hypothetical protein [Urbifossiella sp.]
MIRVRRPTAVAVLTADTRTKLAARQTAASAFRRGDPRTEPAWKNFRRTKAGRATLAALEAVFRGKCAFCERVGARTIDHYDPKERSPRRMYRWANLLLCCADCNHAKGAAFPLRDRRPDLLDPTRDEPLDHYAWDLQTGAMGLVTDAARAHRGHTTREQLRLDEGPLRDERRAQLERVLYLLAEVVNQNPIPAETATRLADELSERRPYLGILRFVFLRPTRFTPLIDAARQKLPEIDTWVRPWL